jgi:hypothetical protein
MHKRFFGVDVKKVGGDTSYAGKENRDFCKEKNIQTSFVKRGCPSKIAKEKDFVRCPFIIHTANGVLLAERLIEQQRAKAA